MTWHLTKDDFHVVLTQVFQTPKLTEIKAWTHAGSWQRYPRTSRSWSPPDETITPTHWRKQHCEVGHLIRIKRASTEENEIMPFLATWTDLEIIILSEIRQRKTNIIHHLCVKYKKKIQMNLFTKKFRKQTSYHRGRDKFGIWDEQIWTTIY